MLQFPSPTGALLAAERARFGRPLRQRRTIWEHPVRPRTSASGASPLVRVVSLAMILAGGFLVVGAVFADQLGITWGGEGFGWKQLLAAIVGLVLLLLGAAWLVQAQLGDRPRPRDSFTPQE